MLVASWQEKTGQKVYNEFGVERGQFLNYLNVKTKSAQRKGGYAPDPESDEKTDLLSNILVVDLAGGKKLPSKKPSTPEDKTDPVDHKMPAGDRSPFSPGEILVMDAMSGTLLVRNEFDDMTAVDKYTATPDQNATPVGPGPRGPGLFGPGPAGYGPPGYGPAGVHGPGGGAPPGYGPAGVHGPGGGAPPGYGGLFGNPQPQRQPQTPRK
jgi:hypothetical protein